jgi:uncharacterized Zn ribbon protein
MKQTIIRNCEQCGEQYEIEHPLQRWCSPECREWARNEQRTAARRVWAKAGKPSLEEVESGEAA